MVYKTKFLFCSLSFLVAVVKSNGFATTRNHHFLHDCQRTASQESSAPSRLNETPSSDVVSPVEAWKTQSGIGSYFAAAPRLKRNMNTVQDNVTNVPARTACQGFGTKELEKAVSPEELYAYSDTSEQIMLDGDVMRLDDNDDEEMRQLILEKMVASSAAYENLSSRIQWGKEISTLIGARKATTAW